MLASSMACDKTEHHMTECQDWPEGLTGDQVQAAVRVIEDWQAGGDGYVELIFALYPILGTIAAANQPPGAARLKNLR